MLRSLGRTITDPAKIHEVLVRPFRRFAPPRRVTVRTSVTVSVVLVTNRPQQLDHCIMSFDRQRHSPRELILVTNGDGFDETALAALAARDDIHIVRTDPSTTLGDALNAGVDVARGPILAKFDDDDHYGPDYLVDAVATMARSGCAVVGKKTYFAYLESLDRTVLVHPGNQERRVGRLAGGTIVFHRRVFERVQFPSVNLGEDVRFVRAAERRGFGVFSGRAAGFLQWRAEQGHTWQVDSAELLAASDVVAPGHDSALWCDSPVGRPNGDGSDDRRSS